MKKDINDALEKYLQDPTQFTKEKEILITAYRDIVVDNEKLSFAPIMRITDAFDIILNEL